MSTRQLSFIDNLIIGGDRALRTLASGTQPLTRATPKSATLAAEPLSDAERKHSAALMRVNHSGEVCAQALYQGQALTAKLPEVRDEMEQAAAEEVDHLAWCEQRIKELGGRTSALNPVWFGLSFGIGALAGRVSDKVSLGFVAATEQQVCKHLQTHLKELPANDTASRAIVDQMLVDEAKHAHSALDAGGARFPGPVRAAMTLVSKVMTKTSYRI